jgi:hypothetical protein
MAEQRTDEWLKSASPEQIAAALRAGELPDPLGAGKLD